MLRFYLESVQGHERKSTEVRVSVLAGESQLDREQIMGKCRGLTGSLKAQQAAGSLHMATVTVGAGICSEA